MKSDINGCSTCIKETENYEKFTRKIGRKTKTYYQYDFRSETGKLFSCVKPSLEACRIARDEHFKVVGL